MSAKEHSRLLPRLRVMHGATILLGPGKADLLEAIERCGSIRDAAAELEMSYMRAWTLVRAMNEGFLEPLVVVHRGGAGRGGAELTAMGQLALRLYRTLESDALQATRPVWKKLQKLLRVT